MASKTEMNTEKKWQYKREKCFKAWLAFVNDWLQFWAMNNPNTTSVKR